MILIMPGGLRFVGFPTFPIGRVGRCVLRGPGSRRQLLARLGASFAPVTRGGKRSLTQPTEHQRLGAPVPFASSTFDLPLETSACIPCLPQCGEPNLRVPFKCLPSPSLTYASTFHFDGKVGRSLMVPMAISLGLPLAWSPSMSRKVV